MAARSFDVRFMDRPFARTVTPSGVTLTVERYGFSVDGGPKQATIRATGDEKSLQALLLEMRDEVKIHDERGEAVWWGTLWTVEIHAGALVYGLTLDGMTNKVNIIYLNQSINQTYSSTGTQAETGFASDAASVADYGTMEKRMRGSNSSSAAAAQTRTTELNKRKNPISIGTNVSDTAPDGEAYAMLTAYGWIESLNWRYYTNTSGNPAGIEKNDVLTSEVAAPLDKAQTFNTINFIANDKLENTAATLTVAGASGDYFAVSGTTNNNKVWTVTRTPAPGGDSRVSPSTVTSESGAGRTFRIWLVGQKIYQTFQLQSNNPFYAAAVDIRLRQSASPTDNVLVKLYYDNAGSPGALITSGSTSASAVPTYMSWVSFVFDTPSLLQFGAASIYGLEISRSGSAVLKWFDVGVDTAKSYTTGSLYLYSSASFGWLPRPTDADLIFRLAGIVETTQQIISVASAVGEFLTGTQIDTSSSLKTVPYQDGTQTARQVITNLLGVGTANNKRLVSEVRSDRTLRVYEEPTPGGADDLLLTIDGKLRDRTGAPLAQHKCPYGQWATVKPLVLAQVPNTQVFIEEVEYDAVMDVLRIVRTRDRAADLDLTVLE